MAQLELFWLGNPEIRFNGTEIKLETRKATALLSYLSLEKRTCPREFLATLFWPEFDQKHAMASLRRQISSLTSSLSPEILICDRWSLGFNETAPVKMDIDQFRFQFHAARDHITSQAGGCSEKNLCVDCLQRLEKSVSLYRGEFLEGFNLRDCPDFDEWQYFQRDSLRNDYAQALKWLAYGYAWTGNWQQAIIYSRQWVKLDRTHEPAQRLLIQVYAQSGQKNLATHQYEEFAQLLDEELGQVPEAETTELLERVQSGGLGPQRREQPNQFAAQDPRSGSFQPVQTKLLVPHERFQVVARKRLEDLLVESPKKALTLISAPAGFGKTTLVSRWAIHHPESIGWVSLDEADNDPVYFLAYLLAGVKAVYPEAVKGPYEILHSPSPIQIRSVLGSLINGLQAASRPGFVVLDDYHFIRDNAIHEGLAFLIERIPAHFHIILSTREDPPLPLSRLRARSQILEIRESELRFTPDEASEYLTAVMGLALAPHEIETLETKTEGWIVGLQMVALSLRRANNPAEFIRDFTGSHRFVMDYLFEQVLNRLPELDLTFLLFTSILRRLTASLCEAVTGQPDGQITLERLERANLFLIPLDNQRRWYRYHHLFADLLLARLKQLYPDRIVQLRRNAADWHMRYGSIEEAVEQALSAKDFEYVADIIESAGQASFVSTDLATYSKWVSQIPDQIIATHPWSSVTLALNRIFRGSLDGVEDLLQRTEKFISGENESQNTSSIQDLLANIALARMYIAFFHGNTQAAVEQGLVARQMVRPANTILRGIITLALGESYSILGQLDQASQCLHEAISINRMNHSYQGVTTAYFRLGNVLKIQGNLAEAEKVFRENIQVLHEMGVPDSPVIGKPEVGLADVLRERGNLDEARILLEAGIKHSEQIEQPYDLISACIYQANLLLSLGKIPQGLDALARAEPLFQAYTIPPVVRMAWELMQVRLWTACGKMDSSEQWVKDHYAESNHPFHFQDEYIVMGISRVLFAQGKSLEAFGLLSRLEESNRAGERYGRLISILMLKAMVLHDRGENDAAFDSLEGCIALAQPRGYFRSFVDEGIRMRAHLEAFQTARGDTIADSQKVYIQKLLGAFTSPPKDPPKHASSAK